MEKEIGVKEIPPNSNMGKDVEKYQKSTNSSKGSSYCASFIKWCNLQIGRNLPINAWSPTCFNKKNPVYFNNKFIQEPVNGDILTIYSLSKKRIVHAGFYHSYYNNKLYISVEANTSANGVVSGSAMDVNGNGVYKKLRSYNATYAISRF